MLLTDRVAVVSGVGPGVGRSVALRFAQEGAKVVLACRGVEKAEAIGDEVRELGRDVLVQSCDVTQPEQCQALVAGAVLFFASDLSSAITGQSLKVNCGQLLS
jgi:NAD(P)-dependent dehydrogenase (short-subunit alcohol dehydrogenase family)